MVMTKNRWLMHFVGKKKSRICQFVQSPILSIIRARAFSLFLFLSLLRKKKATCVQKKQ
jgi:hypothetical protein